MIIGKDQWTAILANFVRKSVVSSNSIKNFYYSCNDRVYTFKLKCCLKIVAIFLSLETRLRAVFVFSLTKNKESIINAIKEIKHQFILKSYVPITQRINKYICSYESKCKHRNLDVVRLTLYVCILGNMSDFLLYTGSSEDVIHFIHKIFCLTRNCFLF